MTNLAKGFNSASFFLSIFLERRIYAVGFRVRHNGKRIGEVADKLDEKFNLVVT